MNHLKLFSLKCRKTCTIKKNRASHSQYVIKTLRKTIVHRSPLETKYFKTKIQTELKLYRKQENVCSKLYKRERRKCQESSDMKNISYNIEFWKTLKPFLSGENNNKKEQYYI